ncbi:hypothetical protein VE01_01742 [Pseudogymnoascus verrucosus]|uniref:Uncharacterized protein n=1 Tax=Pseudogymnoascus verrucosus TaxID=342668 RepID=A0A1B8GWH3_9PEZI|nr:uncharacterized protein VE01_01742 [Pseudogymnoascus verrucosus]OBU00185.1 hypothetical protein VE01_01742 [Pseudogymnoascus verrucosus]
MQTYLPLLAVGAFALVALTQASVDVQVMSPNLKFRSLAFDQIESPLRLTNITRWDAPSSATTRDLDIAPRGPTGVSTYLEHEKRVNNGVLAAVWAGIAAGFAKSLEATKRAIDEVVWSLDPQYIPTVNSSLRSTLAATAPHDKRDGSDGEIDWSAYIYWGDVDESELDYEKLNYDTSGVIDGVAIAYTDYVENNQLTVACADTYIDGYSDNAMVSLWYWSPTPNFVL